MLHGEKVARTLGGTNMGDMIFVALTIFFFLLSIAYVKFCDHIR
jgi:hypothetical protein